MILALYSESSDRFFHVLCHPVSTFSPEGGVGFEKRFSDALPPPKRPTQPRILVPVHFPYFNIVNSDYSFNFVMYSFFIRNFIVMDVIRELDKEFVGIGEVRGFKFRCICDNDRGFLYEVDMGNGNVHFEVFVRKINRRYSCVSYPRSASFGRWAWTYRNLESAKTRFGSL